MGKIIAVCISPKRGLPKYPQDEVEVGEHGFIGDVQYSGDRELRQLTLVSKEIVDEINTELGTSIIPGGLAENILVEGFGDFSQFRPGACLRIGGVVLRLTGQNDPCEKLNIFHKNHLIVKKIYGRRGVTAIVKFGIGCKIRPGDKIEVI